MTRAKVAVREPNLNRDYSAFPSETTVSRAVYRSHHRAFGAWYYSSEATDAGGRFDLAPPEGTCYVADAPEVAVRERLGPTYSQAGVVPFAIAAEFVVSEIRLAAGRTLADFTDPSAAVFGVTTELSSMDGYSIPQAWARILQISGFDGIRYLARFSPGRGPNAVALFGESGARATKSRRVVEGTVAAVAAGFELLSSPATGRGISLSRPPAGWSRT